MQNDQKTTHDQKMEERVRALEKHVANIPNKEEISEIVRDTMKDVLFKTGKSTKAILLTTAVVIGALVVIGGGLKAILGWIGFTYLK